METCKDMEMCKEIDCVKDLELHDSILKQIDNKLNEIEEKENVKILHAVESGSRAWGFASPDSDYDVRFVYVRKKKDYLRIDTPRDVIEWQLDEVLDINGWDLKKALAQFHRGNATLFEWSNSPVVYRTTDTWAHIYAAAKHYFSVKASLYHYYGTANSTYCQYLQEDFVKYKKYFYALRPLLAGRYIQAHQSPPPVLFDELMAMDMPGELRQGIESLLMLKRKSNEADVYPQIQVIRDFIAQELAVQKDYTDRMLDDRKTDWDVLNDIFLWTLTQEV